MASLTAEAPVVTNPSTTSHAALERPTELQYWDPSRAEEGYTFFGAGGKTYLIDMEGRIVHIWPVGTNPHLLANGNVLDAATNDPSGFGSFKEVDWNGLTVCLGTGWSADGPELERT